MGRTQKKGAVVDKDQMTEQEAIALYKSEWWKDSSEEDIVRVQLFQDRLCLPFDEFHRATEGALGRPVFSHEFAYRDWLVQEFLGDKEAPTFEEIVELIPADKRIILVNPGA